MATPGSAPVRGGRRAQGRAPLPRTYRAYVRELEGLRRFLGSLDAYEPAYGPTWVAKMRAHYEGRLKRLERMKPPQIKPRRP